MNCLSSTILFCALLLSRDLQTILTSYVEAVGGREAMQHLESRTVTGRQVDDRPYRGLVAVTPLVLSFPDPELQDRKTNFLLDPQGPLRLEHYFPGLRPAGTRTVDGRLKYILESDLDPAYYALQFDVETGLLTGIGYYWTLSDYRLVDGVLLPFRIHKSRKGGSTVWEIDTVEHGTR